MCNVCACTLVGCVRCGYGLGSHPHDNGSVSDSVRLVNLSLAVAEFLFGDFANDFAQNPAIIRLRQQYRKYGKQD